MKKFVKKAVPEDINKVVSAWRPFTDGFNEPVRSILKNSYPGYLEGDLLYIVFKDLSSLDLIKRREDMLKEELVKKFGKEFSLFMIIKDEYDNMHSNIYGITDDGPDQALKEEEILQKINYKVDIQ